MLPLIQLTLGVSVVSALWARRLRLRSVELFLGTHVSAGTANRPGKDERILRVADGNLLDIEDATVGIEVIGRCQFFQCHTGSPGHFNRFVFLVRFSMLVVDRAVETNASFRKCVIREQAIVCKDLQGCRATQALQPTIEDAHLLLDFQPGLSFLLIQLSKLIP